MNQHVHVNTFFWILTEDPECLRTVLNGSCYCVLVTVEARHACAALNPLCSLGSSTVFLECFQSVCSWRAYLCSSESIVLTRWQRCTFGGGLRSAITSSLCVDV